MALLTIADPANPRTTLIQTSPLAKSFLDYYDAAIAEPSLNLCTLELCRLRFAQLLGAPGVGEAIAGANLTADKAQSVSNWHIDSRFSVSDQACLMFAEQFLLDPQQLTDDQVDAVRENFGGNRGLTAFILVLGLIEQYQRLLLLLDPQIAGLVAQKPSN